MKSVSFPGGLQLSGPRSPQPLTLETLPAPETLIVPLLQHTGPACSPAVQKGDFVHQGDIIAQNAQTTMIAPVSGYIEDTNHTCLAPHGSRTAAIRIANDGQDILSPARDLSLKSMDKIFQAGINDFSSRHLPLFTQLAQAQEKGIQSLIINGLDEATVCGGHSALCAAFAPDVLRGILILQELLRAEQVFIAVYAQAKQAVSALKQNIQSEYIRLVPCRAKHPQHKEQLLISVLLGQEYPPQIRPEDMGITVIRAETAFAVAQCVVHDQPFVHKLLTIHGPVPGPSRGVFVRLGTTLKDVIELLGQDEYKLGKVILGGPFTGQALFSLDVPVSKQAHALCLQTKDQIHRPRDKVCFKCGSCHQVCPMRLMPFLISGFSESNNPELALKHDIHCCIECGCCAYVCPAGIPLVQWIQMGKNAIAGISSDENRS
jgi:electron transport complex protein RnfC